MTNLIDQIQIILSTLSTYEGGTHPTYENVDAIDASGTKFILVPVAEGNGQNSTYTVRKYKIQLKASSQANLETAIGVLEKLSSDAYTSATKYTLSMTPSYIITASDSLYGKGSLEETIYGFAATTPQIVPDKYYTDGNNDWGIMCRFALPAYLTGLTFTAIQALFTPVASLTKAGAFMFYIPTTQTALLANYETWNVNQGYCLATKTFPENFVADTEYETGAFSSYTGDILTIAALSTWKTSQTTIDGLFTTSFTNTSSKIYSSANSGKEPKLEVTVSFPSDYPYWLTLKFEQDFSNQNQFYATFDVEARWAL